MEKKRFSAKEAAEKLGIKVLTFYGWLSQSDTGEFLVRGQPYAIDYFQGGPSGQGRIQIEPSEIDRLREAMRVRPLPKFERRPRIQQHLYPGIIVPLGNAD